VVHKLPTDLRKALLANDTALATCNDITPLTRNEFICWVEDAKQERPANGGSAGHRRNSKRASAGRAVGRGCKW
jgi:hypothetical protein